MSALEKLATFRNRIRRDGLRTGLAAAYAGLRDRVRPPSETILWLRPADVVRIEAPAGATLRVLRSLDELSAEERREVERSISASTLDIWRQRFAAGLEAHLMFLEGRLAASRFVIWGRACPFFHVVLTENDTMSMDLRVDPDLRGRGLATAFFSQSVQELARSGCERIYVTVLVNNVTVNRMVERLGFKPLVRWRHVRGGYGYERPVIR